MSKPIRPYLPYQDYGDMLASAQKRPQLWRLPVGLCAAFVAAALLTPLLLTLAGAVSPDLRALEVGRDGALTMGTTPLGLFMVLASFLLLMTATFATAKWLHKRGMRDVIGPAGLLRRDMWRVGKWVAAFTCILLLLPWPTSDPSAEAALLRQHSFGVWALWLPLGLLGLMMQVSAEEVFFRGYLQPHLIAATGRYWTGILLASLIFGAGHYGFGVEGPAAFLPVAWATLFGLVAGDLTARTGSLGAATAIHFINNAVAIFIAPTQGQLSGLGLWVRDIPLETAYSDPLLICFEVLSLLIMWLIARITLKR